MELRLQSLRMENFKCFRDREITFDAGLTSIYGDNATGKTTVYDALTWLLFGKNSKGAATFGVKPIGAPDGIIPAVTAVFAVNGTTLTLKKSMRERWEKPRGRSEAKFAGHTMEYEVDGVPRKESEYKRQIAMFIDEARWKQLTSVYAVARDMNWKDRRALLAEVCGLPDDHDIFSFSGEFAELAAAVGNRSVDDFKAMQIRARKGSNTLLDDLPPRIDENERMVRELAALDFAAAEQNRAAQSAERDKLREMIAKLDGDTLLTQAQQESIRIQNELAALENENMAYRISQDKPVADPRTELKQAIRLVEAEMLSLGNRRNRLESENAQEDHKLETLRERWHAASKEAFSGRTVCPTCGQAIPAEQIEAARKGFEIEKENRLNDLVGASADIKALIAGNDKEIADLQVQEKACFDQLAALKTELDGIPAPEKAAVFDLPEYAARKEALNTALQEACERVKRIRADRMGERDGLTRKVWAAEEAIRECDSVLAKRKLLEDTRKRVEELNAERRTAAEALEGYDKMIALCEEFARFRAQFIQDSINSAFELVEFRLFREQINGGLEDCCDVMVDGVPYGDLNNAMQINAGLDIIRVLSAHYDSRVPLFVDNAEGVTRLQETGGQVVRLVVSENDKELRIE